MSAVFKEEVTFKKLIKFAIPNMIMMVFLSMYVIIDGIFISSKVSNDALGGVNIVYPVVSLIFAVSIMLGTGGGALISKKLGEGKHEEARRNLTTLILIEFLLGVTFAIVGNIFLDQIVNALGMDLASATQLEYGKEYLRIMLLLSPFLFLQCGFQTFFITAGKPTLGLIVVILAGVTNIVLDYLLIVVFNVGVSGAALATTLGAAIPAILGVVYFAFVRSGNLYLVKPKFELNMIGKSCANGSSEMLSNLSNAVTTLLFNFVFLKLYGDAGTAAITVILYFQFIVVAIYFGYVNGISPVISYKYGEGKMNDVSKVLKKSLLFMGCLALFCYTASFLLKGPIIGAFTDKGSEVYDIAMYGVVFFTPSFLFMGFNVLASGFFTALNDGFSSGLISICRTLIFLSTSILLCSFIFGGAGAFFSVAVAEVCGLCVSIPILLIKRKKYKY